MAIPTRNDLWRPVLEIMSATKVKEAVHRKDILVALLDRLKNADTFTEDEQEELLEVQGSGQTKIENTMGWALTDLSIAGLLVRPSRGYYRITELGAQHCTLPEEETRDFVAERAKERREKTQKGRKKKQEKAEQDNTVRPQETKKRDDHPEEQLAILYDELNDRLAAELLEKVRTMPPAAFEQLVVNLLEQMGYGRGEVTRQGSDEGIDGIISQDALGLEKVYIQAKRWGDNSVGAPQIDGFAGSLDRKGASKGVFITSSTFTRAALDGADQSTKLIRLIDGEELVRLMMRYGVGVITKERYDVRQIDENFFVEGSDPVVPLSWQPTQMLLSPGDLFTR